VRIWPWRWPSGRTGHDAFDEDPLDSQCLEALGFIKLKLGDYGNAKHFLERALLLDRRNVPSSARVLEALKSGPPGRGSRPDELWAKLRRSVRLTG
jgi:hypothetical protein